VSRNTKSAQSLSLIISSSLRTEDILRTVLGSEDGLAIAGMKSFKSAHSGWYVGLGPGITGRRRPLPRLLHRHGGHLERAAERPPRQHELLRPWVTVLGNSDSGGSEHVWAPASASGTRSTSEDRDCRTARRVTVLACRRDRDRDAPLPSHTWAGPPQGPGPCLETRTSRRRRARRCLHLGAVGERGRQAVRSARAITARRRRHSRPDAIVRPAARACAPPPPAVAGGPGGQGESDRAAQAAWAVLAPTQLRL
jgi:hypothetical protein